MVTLAGSRQAAIIRYRHVIRSTEPVNPSRAGIPNGKGLLESELIDRSFPVWYVDPTEPFLGGDGFVDSRATPSSICPTGTGPVDGRFRNYGE